MVDVKAPRKGFKEWTEVMGMRKARYSWKTSLAEARVKYLLAKRVPPVVPLAAPEPEPQRRAGRSRPRKEGVVATGVAAKA